MDISYYNNAGIVKDFTIALFQFPERHVSDEIWNVDSSENSAKSTVFDRKAV
ncbi:MAG: hypothetical protein WBF33_14925 [Candidatus Nitrosopolaris sp.]|jgi:hypothetical protein